MTAAEEVKWVQQIFDGSYTGANRSIGEVAEAENQLWWCAEWLERCVLMSYRPMERPWAAVTKALLSICTGR